MLYFIKRKEGINEDTRLDRRGGDGGKEGGGREHICLVGRGSRREGDKKIREIKRNPTHTTLGLFQTSLEKGIGIG